MASDEEDPNNLTCSARPSVRTAGRGLEYDIGPPPNVSEVGVENLMMEFLRKPAVCYEIDQTLGMLQDAGCDDVPVGSICTGSGTAEMCLDSFNEYYTAKCESSYRAKARNCLKPQSPKAPKPQSPKASKPQSPKAPKPKNLKAPQPQSPKARKPQSPKAPKP
jgi:hypothetical protein